MFLQACALAFQRVSHTYLPTKGRLAITTAVNRCLAYLCRLSLGRTKIVSSSLVAVPYFASTRVLKRGETSSEKVPSLSVVTCVERAARFIGVWVMVTCWLGAAGVTWPVRLTLPPKMIRLRSCCSVTVGAAAVAAVLPTRPAVTAKTRMSFFIACYPLISLITSGYDRFFPRVTGARNRAFTKLLRLQKRWLVRELNEQGAACNPVSLCDVDRLDDCLIGRDDRGLHLHRLEHN